jgi:hypothetical protein
LEIKVVRLAVGFGAGFIFDEVMAEFVGAFLEGVLNEVAKKTCGKYVGGCLALYAPFSPIAVDVVQERELTQIAESLVMKRRVGGFIYQHINIQNYLPDKNAMSKYIGKHVGGVALGVVVKVRLLNILDEFGRVDLDHATETRDGIRVDLAMLLVLILKEFQRILLVPHDLEEIAH